MYASSIINDFVMPPCCGWYLTSLTQGCVAIPHCCWGGGVHLQYIKWGLFYRQTFCGESAVHCGPAHPLFVAAFLTVWWLLAGSAHQVVFPTPGVWVTKNACANLLQAANASSSMSSLHAPVPPSGGAEAIFTSWDYEIGGIDGDEWIRDCAL